MKKKAKDNVIKYHKTENNKKVVLLVIKQNTAEILFKAFKPTHLICFLYYRITSFFKVSSNHISYIIFYSCGTNDKF